MPFEHRFIAAFLILAGVGLTLCLSWQHLCAPLVPLTALVIVAVGLLPPTPRMVNAVVVLLAGALMTFIALVDGIAGSFVIAIPVIASSALMLGWRGTAWALAACVLPAMLARPEALATPGMIERPLDLLALAALVGWIGWLVHQFAGSWRRRSGHPRVGLAMTVAAAAGLPFVSDLSLPFVALYLGWLTACHELATEAA